MERMMDGMAKGICCLLGSMAVMPISIFGQNANKKPLPSSLAAQCAPDLEKAPERIFARRGSQDWREYPNLKQVPQADPHSADQLFTVRTSATGKHFVRLVQYGSGYAVYEGSCYLASGKLRSVHYQMRTAWGWGYEDVRRFTATGTAASKLARYFNTATNKKIARPMDANRVPNSDPPIFQTFDSLPFILVFKQGSHATQK